MNGAHLHLLVNHIPVLGVPFAVGLLLASLWRQNLALQRAGLVVLILAGISTEVALLTGDPAKHVLKTAMAAEYPKAAISRHEDAADKALIGAGVLAVIALGALWVARRGPIGRGPVVAMVIAALLVTGVLAWVADLGGEVRHTEIQGTPPS